MAQIIDQIVKVSIQDAISSVTTVDVNKMALVGTSNVEGAVATKILSVEGAEEAFGADSQLTAMVKAFYAQDVQPISVICIPAGDDALASVKAAASEGHKFYHVVFATESVDVATLKTWQEWLADAKKVAEIQVSDAQALLNHKQDRIAIFQHDVDGEYLNVAITAKKCAMDSARGSYSHKTVQGITADNYTAEQFASLTDGGINIYTEVAGEARVFFGTTGSNEDFIDSVIKDDWVRFNIQSRIYKLFGEGNDGQGVNYEDAGISSIGACVLNVLEVGADEYHQYLMKGRNSVNVPSYAYLKENYAEDVRKRNLPLVSGKYSRMGTLNSAQVSIQVVL